MCGYLKRNVYLRAVIYMIMKKTFLTLAFSAFTMLTLLLVGCDDYETYAEQKEKEYKNINAFIEDNGINLITFEQFCAQDSMTDVSKNEYVPITVSTTSGTCDVYMQIVRKGEGRYQRKGENRNMLVRYYEYSVADRDTVTGNIYAQAPDEFTCKRTGDTYSGTFTYGYMLSIYSSSTVPTGWLAPMPYIRPGRPNDKGAYVKLIVPHDAGTSTAQSYVTAYFYEINFMPAP